VTPRRRLAAQIASKLLFLAGAMSIAGVMYTYASAHAFQSRELARLHAYHAVPAAAAERVVVAPPHSRVARADGATIGEIRIDRLQMDAVIAEGDSNAVLRRAVGHLSDTPMPGESGNVVLAAHRDTFFRPLKSIRAGDVIEIVTEYQIWRYRVDWSRVVSPSDTSVLGDAGDDVLTLVTCYPFEYVGRAPTRFVVRASAVR
jgi:sortase A